MRPIDADAIEYYEGEYPPTPCVSKKYIDSLQTIDAVLIKHGHWIDTGSGEECSICREVQYGYDSFRNYCANCGAKMDEVIDQ